MPPSAESKGLVSRVASLVPAAVPEYADESKPDGYFAETEVSTSFGSEMSSTA